MQKPATEMPSSLKLSTSGIETTAPADIACAGLGLSLGALTDVLFFPGGLTTDAVATFTGSGLIGTRYAVIQAGSWIRAATRLWQQGRERAMLRRREVIAREAVAAYRAKIRNDFERAQLCLARLDPTARTTVPGASVEADLLRQAMAKALVSDDAYEEFSRRLESTDRDGRISRIARIEAAAES
jgi:hypothetical protein